MFTEFFLQNFPRQGDNHTVYRVCLGDIIPATERVTFTPGEKSPDLRNNTGSIGYMDVVIKEQSVPKIDAKPMPNPRRSRYLVYEYAASEFEIVQALTIYDIAIEPPFRRKDYSRLLQEKAEELALEWGLNIVVSEQILNPIMRRLSYRMGYTLYGNGKQGVKRLK